MGYRKDLVKFLDFSCSFLYICYTTHRTDSQLRNYKSFGFDTSKFENELEKYQIKDIVDYYEAIQAKINQEFYRDKNREEYVAGSDFIKTKSLGAPNNVPLNQVAPSFS